MKHSSGNHSPQNTQTSPQNTQTASETTRHRGFFSPRARAWLLGAALATDIASGTLGFINTHNHEQTPERTPASIANKEARILAGEINDIYAHGPGEYERANHATEEGFLRQVSARDTWGVHFMQLKGFEDGDMTGSNLREVFVSDTLLDPATHRPADNPSYSLDITFDRQGVSTITVHGSQAYPNDPTTEQLTFNGDRAVNQNGQSVDAGQVTDVFNGAHAEVLNQTSETGN